MINGLVRPGDGLTALSQTQPSFLGTTPVTLTDQGTAPNCPRTSQTGPCSALRAETKTRCGGTLQFGGKVRSKARSKSHHSKSHTWLFLWEGTVLDGQAARAGSAAGAHTLWLHLPFTLQKKIWGLKRSDTTGNRQQPGSEVLSDRGCCPAHQLVFATRPESTF